MIVFARMLVVQRFSYRAIVDENVFDKSSEEI